MSDLVLEHKRVGETYKGRVSKDGQIILGFDGIDFENMLVFFSNILRDHDGCGAVLHRTDKPGLKALPLNDREVEQLKTDPKAVAKALSAPDRTVKIRDTASPQSSVKMRLRAGVATLADAFGDRLYIRKKEGKVESPFTGRWVELKHAELGFTHVDVIWVSISTVELLDFDMERYFLPRRWNTSGPWITHEDLEKKYDDFIKERANA